MTKVERSYHDNGSIAAESLEIDGSPHGIVRYWHPNGVLAKEIPTDHGVIDGTVKQWNDKGELIATSELENGTGVLRTLNEQQGLDGEITYVNGKWTGRQRCYCGGDLIAAVYWLDGNKVSRKRYLEASKQNPNLPQYEDEPQIGAKKPAHKKAAKPTSHLIKSADELPLKLLQGSRVREALAWLQEGSQPSRSLGEATGQDESIRFVKELHSLGAVAVHAVEIDGAANNDQNTGRLVIELPQDQKRRRNVLEFCGDIAREAGFDTAPDIGQCYLLLMLD